MAIKYKENWHGECQKGNKPVGIKNDRLNLWSPLVFNKRLKDHKTRYQLVDPYLFSDT